MFQHVSTVLVASALAGAFAAAEPTAKGTLFIDAELADGTHQYGIAAALPTNTRRFRFGLVGDTFNDGTLPTRATKASIQYSQWVQKDSISSVTSANAEAPTYCSVEIDMTGFAPVLGTTYELRVVRNDIYEHPGQQTYSYYYTAKSTTLDTMGAAFVKSLNADPNIGVTAAYADSVLTLEAQEIDWSNGLHPVDRWSMIDIDANVTFRGQGLLAISGAKQAIPATIAKVAPQPGHGFWKVVRDQEHDSLLYRGIEYSVATQYPFIAPEPNTVIGGEYNGVSIEYNNMYRSNDNQYIKDTPLSIQLYTTAAVSNIVTAVNTWLGNTNLTH
jgi:hypothetical protein